jgi:hypothetical protein
VPRALSRGASYERGVHLRVLVTGCGRSGTRYTTFVLRRHGLDVGHERLGRDGVASWSLAVDADHVPWGPSRQAVSFDVILHQTRHPLKVVCSAMSFKDQSWRFICEHIPCSLEDPLPLRAAAYWYYWNAAAERRADLTFRVENVRGALGEICERLGVEADPSVLDHVPTDVNTRRNGRAFHLAEEAVERLRLEPVPWLRARLAHDRPVDAHPPVRWRDIRALDPVLCDDMLAMARGYGYEP